MQGRDYVMGTEASRRPSREPRSLSLARLASLTLILAAGGVSHASAAGAAPPPVESKYHITAEERTACGMDAVELCSDTYPDEDKLLHCMKVNRVNLSAICRPVFEEGIRRRHLN